MSEDFVEMMLATTLYCICSAGMLLSNKLAIHDFPLECALVFFQLLFTVLFLGIFAFPYIRVGSMKDFLRWSLVAPMYCGMLLTSILALKAAPMSLVIVLRNASPLGTLFFERFYPEPLRISKMMLLSMVMMLAGAFMYMTAHVQPISWVGAGWVLLNGAIAVADRLLQRLLLAKNQYPVDISKTGITFINNFIGMIVVGIAMVLKGEVAHVADAVKLLTLQGKVNVALSCVLGMAISYTSIWAQSLITATSFLVMTNANKFIIIAVEAWGMHSTMTPVQVCGASMTILGGLFYGKARQEIEQEGERAALKPAKFTKSLV